MPSLSRYTQSNSEDNTLTTQELTAREWDRLANAMESMNRKLEQTGDFPEQAEYKAIARKARDNWAIASVREAKTTCG